METAEVDPVKTILVVEDDALLRGQLAGYLSRRGWKVLEAGHGGQALGLLEGTDVRMIMTDLHMPFMDGFALIKQIYVCPRLSRAGVVAMSGRPGRDTEALRREFPELVFLSKPFTLEALDAALRQAGGSGISF
jgi:DNA-binding response OmpR family regulator